VPSFDIVSRIDLAEVDNALAGIKREITTRFDFKPPEKAAGNTLRQAIALKQGIDADLARRLVREIKDSKLKVQAAVQGGELRVTGKKRDDLQAAIGLVRGLKIEQPLQYVNFRE